MRRKTIKEFIEKAKKVHGDEYDYSKVEYKNNSTKVCIICKKHGEFWQKPNNHIDSKNGCPICRYTKSGNSNRHTLEEFIEKAKKVHGDEYDYSKVEYKRYSVKVCIICKKHGEFWQTPNDHIGDKNKCPKCSYKKMGIKRMGNVNEFIEKAKNFYGDSFDYTKVEYNGRDNKVCIICKKHGEFWQRAADHIRGIRGCPSCSIYKGEIKIENFLKLNNIKFKRQFAFENCKLKKKLKFDFGILNNNDELICLVEYDGMQHYLPITFSSRISGEDSLNINKIRDGIKNDYCKKNNILLKRIKYDQDIEIEIKKILEGVNFGN